MNIAEYISSGILEQYVSGTASAQEMQEVECMSHIYPEIKLEIVSMQKALEAMAMAEAKAPPVFLKNKILTALKELNNETTIAANNAKVPALASIELAKPTIEKSTGKIFNFSSYQLKYAASVLLIVTAGLGIYSLASKSTLNEKDSQLAALMIDLQEHKKSLAEKNAQLAIVSDINFKPTLLKGIETKSLESAAIIYWNKASQEVYIAVASLPKPADNMQYQLWAIADGKPVDMGMIDELNIKAAFQKMKTIGNAQAFAITLEKKGGVASPTLSEMYVMGGV
jgi:anti-sigma-K factor RskA